MAEGAIRDGALRPRPIRVTRSMLLGKRVVKELVRDSTFCEHFYIHQRPLVCVLIAYGVGFPICFCFL